MLELKKFKDGFNYHSLKPMLAKRTTVSADNKRKIAKTVAYIIVIISFYCIFNMSISFNKCMSGSMEPTIMTGDIYLTSKQSYRFKDPRVGDIIVFWWNGVKAGKRVIGVPGDTISFSDGHVIRNGEKLDEAYLPATDTETNSLKTFKVPKDSVFVLGDNRESSYDSRYWKQPYVPYKDIIGKVFVIFPVHTLGTPQEEVADILAQTKEDLR